MALEYRGFSVIGLNRGAVPLLEGTSRYRVAKGAYVISDSLQSQLTIVSTGSDLHRAVEAARILNNEPDTSTRVVSMPSMRSFEVQPLDYIRSVIPWDGRPVVSIEAMSTHGWSRWSTASIGMDRFGTTVHADAVMAHFKLAADDMARRIRAYVRELDGRNAQMAGWKVI